MVHERGLIPRLVPSRPLLRHREMVPVLGQSLVCPWVKTARGNHANCKNFVLSLIYESMISVSRGLAS